MARPQVLSASSLLGTPVSNAQGENLGKVEEIMIDLETGSVAYAVLSFAGLLGAGDKHFAVPWSALRVDPQKRLVYLDIDRSMLESAPGYDKDDLPDVDLDYLTQVFAHYRIEPYWQTH